MVKTVRKRHTRKGDAKEGPALPLSAAITEPSDKQDISDKPELPSTTIIVKGRQLAELFRVNATTIAEWCASGKIVRVGHDKYILQSAIDYHSALHGMDLDVYKAAQADRTIADTDRIKAETQHKLAIVAKLRSENLQGVLADERQGAVLHMRLLSGAAAHLESTLARFMRVLAMRVLAFRATNEEDAAKLERLIAEECNQDSADIVKHMVTWCLGERMDYLDSRLFEEVTGLRGGPPDDAEHPDNLHYTSTGFSFDRVSVPAGWYRWQNYTAEEAGARKVQDGHAHFGRFIAVEGPKLPENIIPTLHKIAQQLEGGKP
jgi:hypothetical protein